MTRVANRAIATRGRSEGGKTFTGPAENSGRSLSRQLLTVIRLVSGARKREPRRLATGNHIQTKRANQTLGNIVQKRQRCDERRVG